MAWEAQRPAVTTSARPDGQRARSQRARRERILDAVLDLATEGGYDAVQLRSIAQRAHVAVRTIYNHFGSRENVLLEAMIRWRRQVTSESVAAASGATFADRLLSILRHNFEVFEQRPKLFETFMRAGVSVETAMPLVESIGRTANPDLDSLDDGFREDFGMILGCVVHSSMSSAAGGLIGVEEVWTRVERAIRRLAASAPNAGT
jgi:AcrR family transcriptional regulator